MRNSQFKILSLNNNNLKVYNLSKSEKLSIIITCNVFNKFNFNRYSLFSLKNLIKSVKIIQRLCMVRNKNFKVNELNN